MRIVAIPKVGNYEEHGKAAGGAARGAGSGTGSALFLHFAHIYFTMDPQPPIKPWERRIPGAMSAPINYR